MTEVIRGGVKQQENVHWSFKSQSVDVWAKDKFFSKPLLVQNPESAAGTDLHYSKNSGSSQIIELSQKDKELYFLIK